MLTKSICLSLTTLGLVAALHAADWPQYRGPNHDGTSPESMPKWPANGLSAKWKVPTENGFSSFAVRDGRAFTQVTKEIDSVPREVVLALNAETGKQLWALPVGVQKYGHDGGNAGARGNAGGDGPRSTPTVDGERVYVLSSDLLLLCLDAATGKEIWTKDIIREHKGEHIKWKNAASPLIEGNLIFVAGGGKGQALLAIDKNSGAVVWKGQDDTMTHATPVPATIHGVKQIIFFTEKGLVAVKPQSGDVLWRHPYRFSVSTAASPVVADDIVYCSAGYGVGATAVRIRKDGNKFSAEEIWRETGDKLANHWSTPVYKDGHLYGMFQFKEYGDGPVKCVELATGKVKWEKAGFGPGNLILVDDKLVILSDSGELVLADATPQAYREQARFQAITGKCWSSPGLSDGRIYIRSTREGACFELPRAVARN